MSADQDYSRSKVVPRIKLLGSKGMMAEIGKRTGVAILFNKIKLHGFVAWWLWRTYYLANLPTTRKKFKVLGDWISCLSRCIYDN